MGLRTQVVVALAVSIVPAVSAADPAADQAAVRATVDAWLAAQNQGRFDAYAALYDGGFQGVKRVGNTQKTMRRAAWLADRKAMFRQKMVVTARDVAVTVATDTAEVTLAQGWAQGDFADEGQKRLTLARTAAGWKISREEMVTSRVVLTAGACRKALLGKAGATTGDITVVALRDERHACGLASIDADPASGELIVAVLRFDRGWKVIADDRTPFTHTSSDEGGESGRVSIRPIDIAPNETAVLAELETWREGPQFRDTTVAGRLLRVRPAGLDELLAYESKISAGEADASSTHELTVGSARTRGFFDLELRHVTSEHNWQTGEQSEQVETERYRWNGRAYAP